MVKRSLTALLIAMCAAIGPASAAAQEAKGPTYELRLRDGSRLFGAIERQSEEQIEFRTITGSLVTARTADVLALKEVRGGVVDGEFLPDDPNQTRLFFAPTGRSLPKGSVSFGTYEFIMPFVQVGVTDRFSIGGGTPLMFGFDESERPFWITPKLQVVNSGKITAAVGSLHLIASGHTAGIGYGVVTVSEPAGSLSMGAGLAFEDGGGKSAVVMVGADRRVRRNLKLLTENYVFKGGGLLSGGVRFIGDRLSADLGLVAPLGVDGFILFPVANFVYVFQ
jgi:hypothetical protein